MSLRSEHAVSIRCGFRDVEKILVLARQDFAAIADLRD